MAPFGPQVAPSLHEYEKNCTDFLIHGYINDEEIAWPLLQQVAR
jgi:hypothetical protein